MSQQTKDVVEESPSLPPSPAPARLTLDGKEHELPVIVGSEGEVGLDIAQLRARSGAVTFDPYRARFLQAGGKTLFDSTQIPGEIVDILAVRADVFKKHPTHVRALLTGWFGALEYIKADPKDAARRALLSR